MDEKSSVTFFVPALTRPLEKWHEGRVEQHCKLTATDCFKRYIKNRLHMSYVAVLPMRPSKRPADSPVAGAQARKKLNSSASCSSTDEQNRHKALQSNNSKFGDNPLEPTVRQTILNLFALLHSYILIIL